jgi:hypothetical protein
MSCNHFKFGVCCDSCGEDVTVHFHILHARVRWLERAIGDMLAEVESTEADSENEHAECLRNAAKKLVKALVGPEEGK